MSGWDHLEGNNLEGKNTHTGARVVENATLRGPAPGHLGLDHVVNAIRNSPSLYPVTGRHRSS
eukprot:5774640-Prymnesium_polylepis.1